MLTLLPLVAFIAALQGAPIARVDISPDARAVTFMSWDTEGGERFQQNLLQDDSPFKAVVKIEETWQDAPAALHLQYTKVPDGFDLAVTPSSAMPSGVQAIRMVFAFNPAVTPTTILPAAFRDDGAMLGPCIVSAPDFGQMIVRSARTLDAVYRLNGSRRPKALEWVIEFPSDPENHAVTLEFRAAYLPQPPGLSDDSRWAIARRGWFDAFNLTSQWGDQNKRFSAPTGILGNNVLSDPASVSVWMYADMVLFVPELPGGLSTTQYLRRTVDHWLDNRLRPDGNVIGYWDYDIFLDSVPSLLISAWDYIEAAEDIAWLERRMPVLERIAAYALSRDVDNDGLMEAIPSGNRGTLVKPKRSCCWFDAVNFGWKDAYSNALMYRAFCCLADLNARLARPERRAFWLEQASRLKQAYVPALFNPETGWIAMWRSEDGELHDYASPIVNGYAIEYGLVEPSQGRNILAKLHAKMKSAGFSNFARGIPSVLKPITPDDYLQPAFSAPQKPDGSDTWQEYQNGGITTGHVYHFLAAHYVVGMREEADAILDAMLPAQHAGKFQNGVQDAYPKGVDWQKWDGSPCGYEGFLADNARFLLAVLTREAAFHDRMYRPLREAREFQAELKRD